MAKVWAVTYYRREKMLKHRTVAKITGLSDIQVYDTVVAIFDAEDKAKESIRKMVTRDHELNAVRRERGLPTYDYSLNEDDLHEYGDVYSTKYDEDGVRTTIWYSYESFDVM